MTGVQLALFRIRIKIENGITCAVVMCTLYDGAVSLMSFERNVKLSVLLNGPLSAAQCRCGAQ